MMVKESYRFSIEAEDKATAGKNARGLADLLREADGVLETNVSREDNQSMDLGTIVSVVATSGATLAIAQGIASWLRARRGVTLVLEGHTNFKQFKATVAGIDPHTAERIVEKAGKNM